MFLNSDPFTFLIQLINRISSSHLSIECLSCFVVFSENTLSIDVLSLVLTPRLLLLLLFLSLRIILLLLLLLRLLVIFLRLLRLRLVVVIRIIVAILLGSLLLLFRVLKFIVLISHFLDGFLFYLL